MKRLFTSAEAQAGLYALFIFILSSMSDPPVLGPMPLNDKIKHLLLYGVFTVLVCRAVAPRVRRAAIAALVTIAVVSAYGASDEYHQRFTPGRSCDIHDWEADTLAALIVASCYPWRRRKEAK